MNDTLLGRVTNRVTCLHQRVKVQDRFSRLLMSLTPSLAQSGVRLLGLVAAKLDHPNRKRDKREPHSLVGPKFALSGADPTRARCQNPASSREILASSPDSWRKPMRLTTVQMNRSLAAARRRARWPESQGRLRASIDLFLRAVQVGRGIASEERDPIHPAVFRH